MATGTFGWSKSASKSLRRRRLQKQLLVGEAERVKDHLLTACVFHRRFSGDESFLHDPNQFNDEENESELHRGMRGNGARL